MKLMHVFCSDIDQQVTDIFKNQITHHNTTYVSLKFSNLTQHNIQTKPPYVYVTGIKNVKNHTYDPKLKKTFEDLLKKFQPNIIHIYAQKGLSLLPILTVASNLKVKKVLSLYDHSLILSNHQPRRYSQDANLITQTFLTKIKYIINQCDAIICQTPLQKEFLTKIFNHNSKIYSIDTINDDFNHLYRSLMNKEIRSLFLKVGHLCNSKCLYCVAGVANQEFIDLKLLKKQLETISPDYDRVILTGGEPTMHPRFFELLAIIFYLGLQIEIQSNIRIFSSHKPALRIKKYNPKIVVCINSSREDIFDLMADASGAFQQTVRGVKNLVNEGIPVETKIIITNYNFDHLKEIVEFIKNFGIQSVKLVFPTPMGLAKDNFTRINPRYVDIMTSVHQAIQWGLDQKMEMLTENIPFCLLNEQYHPNNAECRGMLDGIYLNSSKGLYNCKTERMDNQKMKLPVCKTCCYNHTCEGIYKEYLKHFDDSEFSSCLVTNS